VWSSVDLTNWLPMGSILIKDGAVRGKHEWHTPGYVWAVDERIVSVAAGDPPSHLIDEAREVISARHCAVLPGLVNAHTHLSQTLMRGLARGRPLLPWLKEIIWPLQAALTPDDLHLATLLGLVENLRCGVTEICNHHKVVTTPAHTDAVCNAAMTTGLRITLARSWADRGTNAESPDSIMADMEHLFGKWRDLDRLKIANGPIALWRCSAETLRRTHKLAQEHGSFTHTHVAENQDELQISLDETGKRPVDWLASIGLLGPDTQVVHAVWVEESEVNLLAQSGTQVIHCPVSNAILGSGTAPLSEFIRQNVSVRLGTDGPASNDTQDIWETLKTALCFARGQSLDATALSPTAALELAMQTKALKPDSLADLIIVNLNRPSAAPVLDIDSALALSTHGSHVDTVIVGGKILMRNRQVLVLDEAALLDASRFAVGRLRKRAGIN
jgi:5-methylthioadenosine/S-adenosylhomocysteine deaminase